MSIGYDGRRKIQSIALQAEAEQMRHALITPPETIVNAMQLKLVTMYLARWRDRVEYANEKQRKAGAV